MKALDPTISLHLLKKQVRLKYLESHIEQVLSNIDGLIQVTRKAAPMRAITAHGTDPYCLDRSRIPKPEEEWLGETESDLERRIFYQWCRQCRPEYCSAWQGIATYQLLLQENRSDVGWGEIDLLGVSTEGLPIVIELKQRNATDTVLAMMLQALAYGIAFEKIWPNVRPYWKVPAKRFAPECLIPNTLSGCALVCAAPEDYWKRVLREERGPQRHSERACQLLSELAEQIEQRGFPLKFVSLVPEGQRFSVKILAGF